MALCARSGFHLGAHANCALLTLLCRRWEGWGVGLQGRASMTGGITHTSHVTQIRSRHTARRTQARTPERTIRGKGAVEEVNGGEDRSGRGKKDSNT
jgi:hypothetical protein